jgi:hypothetical protein
VRISTIKPDALDYLVHLVREIMVRYFKCSYKNEGIPTCKELEAADIEVKRRAGSDRGWLAFCALHSFSSSRN